MLGVMTVRKEELKFREFDRYRGFYCGLCRAIGRDVDKDTEAFLDWLDAFGEKNGIKFTVTISADASLATDGIKKYF